MPRHPLTSKNAQMRREIEAEFERLADDVDKLLADLPQDTYVTASLRRQLMDSLAPRIDQLFADGGLVAQYITRYSEEARRSIIRECVDEWRDALGDDVAQRIEALGGSSSGT